MSVPIAPRPRGEGPDGLRTGATGLNPTQLHPGPGEPAMPTGGEIIGQGGLWLAVGDCSPLFCVGGAGATGGGARLLLVVRNKGTRKDGSPLPLPPPHSISPTPLLFSSFLF